jgi:hypothetical protein
LTAGHLENRISLFPLFFIFYDPVSSKKRFMKNLKISLRHGDVTNTPCSIMFVKHIESSLSMPEKAIDLKMNGELSRLYREHEQEDRQLLKCENILPFKYIYTIIYHCSDLPFSYSSVDKYARKILQLSIHDKAFDGETINNVATAVHGPGAGLDSSESLETMLMAFSNELQITKDLGSLEEIIIVEQDKDVFARLQERLKYLMSTKRIVLYENGDYYLNLEASNVSLQQESTRLKNLTLEHVFIAMPYAKEFNNVYYFGIKQVVEKRGRKCERVDQDKFTGDIVQRIKERINSSQLVIADITGNNPNVYYEVGFGDGSKKTTILISQKQEHIPFDFKTQRQIIYDPQDILGLANDLGEVLDEILQAQ